MTHTLEADSVQLEFGGRRILSDIYLKCETGKIAGLLGRNGCGKTSLLNIIYGNLTPTHKCIRFDGNFILHAFKRPDLLVYLPQQHFIPNGLTLKRIFSDFNIEYVAFEKQFPEFKSHYRSSFKDLSSGQQRLLEIYLILKSSAQFAILDEPFSFLSPVLVEQIKEMIIGERQNKGILVTDHKYRDIIEISDNLYVLSDGKTHLTKSSDDLERLGYLKLSSEPVDNS
ncbi:ATP-binding cassette domain-containing protein [Pedobacter nutrimenti]|uniref:ATP-binding cassette domain-containing protein n=1 Tax=Pedobacter nutrimenti TaxID=1241337 RepID=UPI00292D90A0|nr:ATP-binding cassette domain-containing protein [Pedobacter nutrimenti]